TRWRRLEGLLRRMPLCSILPPRPSCAIPTWLLHVPTATMSLNRSKRPLGASPALPRPLHPLMRSTGTLASASWPPLSTSLM
ncbi:hypothetical protein M9458_001324, partial [Cirrhinus mrigala]